MVRAHLGAQTSLRGNEMIKLIKAKVKAKEYYNLKLQATTLHKKVDVTVSQGKGKNASWITIPEESIEEFIGKLMGVVRRVKEEQELYEN